MALRLKKRELPLVNFRRTLPAFLGPEGADECFIEFKARAGGSINPELVKLSEEAKLQARVMIRKNAKIEDDEESIRADADTANEISLGRFAVLYDACIISWKSNIQVFDDDGKGSDINCNKASFIELCDIPVPEIAHAITDLEKEIMDAGKVVKEEDDKTVKN